MEKYILIPCALLSLCACDFMKPSPPTQKMCEKIALSRLKHPESYDNISRRVNPMENNQIEVKLDFNAWNDFKVPIPQSISCRFQKGAPLKLISIKWNGRSVRNHELTEIQKKFK